MLDTVAVEGTSSAAAGESAVEGLVLLALGGDAAARGELCQRLAPAVRAFARRRLWHREAVDDFTQDVLLTFVEALNDRRIEDPRRAAGFALGICRNLARERARNRDTRKALTERFGAMSEAIPPHEPILIDPARLEDCLSQLTGRARRVLLGAYFDERRDAEIGRQLELSTANVRVIRHRSLALLRECLGTHWRVS